MPKNTPEICSLLNDSCINNFLCGTCSVAHKTLLESPNFKDIHHTQVKSFSSSNRTAILVVPTIDPQNNPNRLILASVRNGRYQKLITRNELSRLKKSQ